MKTNSVCVHQKLTKKIEYKEQSKKRNHESPFWNCLEATEFLSTPFSIASLQATKITQRQFARALEEYYDICQDKALRAETCGATMACAHCVSDVAERNPIYDFDSCNESEAKICPGLQSCKNTCGKCFDEVIVAMDCYDEIGIALCPFDCVGGIDFNYN